MSGLRCFGRVGLLVLLCATVADARAQAWLPEQGEWSYTLSYNDIFNKKHYLPDGSEVDVGHTRSKTVGLSVTWAPTDRLMLAAGIPFVRTEYHGPRPHVGTDVDDGHGQSTVTDLRLELHWQALRAPLALAPYVAAVIPTHDYEVLGHAAPGRGLHEYWVGFFAGKSLDAWLPRTYVQVRCNYAFVQEVVGIAHDRSNLDVELGYFFNPRLAVQAIGSWQWTHGGIDVPVPPSHPLYRYHDQLADDEFLNVGGGVVWFATAAASFYVNYTTSVRGRNGHKLDQGLNWGITYRPGAR
ncbi:MAG: hypothetical protein U1F14_01995 [Steroidobacteraceae bacterium]